MESFRGIDGLNPINSKRLVSHYRLPAVISAVWCGVIAVAKKACGSILQRLSFLLWIAFTILAVCLIGIGVMSILYLGIIRLGDNTLPMRVPLVDSRLTSSSSWEMSLLLPLLFIGAGAVALVISILWRQIGIDRYHYSDYDTLVCPDGAEETLSTTLDRLILEVEQSSGDERTMARAKAKEWLLSHVAAMDEDEILMARNHFGYLLPAQWGTKTENREPVLI